MSEEDQGVPLWNCRDGVASDDESVVLDRLCRILHALNFFRHEGGDAAARTGARVLLQDRAHDTEEERLAA